MGKRLILDITCANDDIDSRPNIFTDEINSVIIDKIKRLSKVVVDNDVYCIEAFYGGAIWSETVEIEHNVDSPEDISRAVDLLTQTPSLVEGPMLRVTRDRFSFEAVPKYQGDESSLLTASVLITELDNDSPYISL